MDYNEFIHNVRDVVAQKLGKEVDVSIQSIKKNNGLILESLSIFAKGEHASPNIYLKDYYEDYLVDEDMDEVIREILGIYHSRKNLADFDAEEFKKFESVKHKIVYKLINYEKNKELLQEVPYKKFLDLAIVFYCLIKSEKIKHATILIYNNHMEYWGTNVNQLYEIADKNTSIALPCIYKSMDNVMKNFLTDSPIIEPKYTNNSNMKSQADFSSNVEYSQTISKQITDEILSSSNVIPMYVITNYDKTYGAATMLYPKFLREIARQLKDNLYILPSSIHECIIIPTSNENNKTKLEEMVTEINETNVSPDEVLSNHVYVYLRSSDRIVL